jgi:hypothetical protein
MSEPNKAQFGPLKDAGFVENQDNIQILTGAASESTQLTVDQLTARLVPPASGVHTFILPPLSRWKNRLCCFYQTVSAPGGQAKIAYAEGGGDVIGDNLSAASDVFIGYNAQGETVLTIKEVTT